MFIFWLLHIIYSIKLEYIDISIFKNICEALIFRVELGDILKGNLSIKLGIKVNIIMVEGFRYVEYIINK